MGTASTLVVVGAGQAAVHLIESARAHGFAGDITLIGEELQPPYSRPPLTKQALLGQHSDDWLAYRSADFYTGHSVKALFGRRAVRIDRERKSLELDDGARYDYDCLALTTGARARRLDVPGADSANVHYIRTLEDLARLRPQLATPRRIAIVGGGFIGTEAAASLAQRGHRIALVAQGSALIPRALPDAIAALLANEHRRHGVDLRFNEKVERLPYPDAELTLVGIGAVPNVELAAAAGLECDDGIVVDEYARTSEPTIVSAGDCTRHPNRLLGFDLRLETAHNAVEQGRTAGATVAGKLTPYVQSPWVWSDQYGLRIQAVGVADGADRTVVRGDPKRAPCSVFSFRGEQLLAVCCVNDARTFTAVRRLLDAGRTISAEQAADRRVDLSGLVPLAAKLEFERPWVPRRRGLSADAWGHA